MIARASVRPSWRDVYLSGVAQVCQNGVSGGIQDRSRFFLGRIRMLDLREHLLEVEALERRALAVVATGTGFLVRNDQTGRDCLRLILHHVHFPVIASRRMAALATDALFFLEGRHESRRWFAPAGHVTLQTGIFLLRRL